MRIGAVYLAASLLSAFGASQGGALWALSWPALSFGLVGAGYLGVGARVLGKRGDGTRPAWSRVLHLPYDLSMHAGAFLLRRFARDPLYDEVAEGVYVGRRAARGALPAGVALVVDMTAELEVPRGLRDSVAYVCLPTLDGHVPSEAAFARLIASMQAARGPLYVHCMAGHGRSATAAAAYLLRRGDGRDLDEVVGLMRRARPQIRLGRRQRRLASRFARPS